MIDMTAQQIETLLANARIGRLCMADTDGRPYAIPLPFFWDGATVYVRLPLTGRKGNILQRNDRVCFEVDEFTDNLDHYASVLIEGRLAEVSEGDEKLRVNTLNSAKYQRLRGGYRPGHGRSRPPAQLPLRKILVEQLTGRAKEPADTADGTPGELDAAGVSSGL